MYLAPYCWQSPTRCCLILISIVSTFSCAHASEPVVASYYSAAGNPTAVASLPAEKLSHILYAFIALCGDNTGANATTQSHIEEACKGKEPYSAVIFNEKDVLPELEAFKRLKQRHSHLRLLPSFGGWTLSTPFHGLAKSESARKHFVQSAVDLIARHDVFDGIDIDWEYPGGGGNSQMRLTGSRALQEKHAFTLMMQEIRAQLNELNKQTGRQYLLTAAVSGSQSKVDAIDWKTVIGSMDYVFAMTYDFAVGDGMAAHHTNLFSTAENSLSTQSMIDNLLGVGIPAQKLVTGVAFYGRGWTNSGWQGGRFDNTSASVSTGSYIYQNLVSGELSGYEHGYDEQAQAAYLYNKTNDTFISFDDVRSVTAKTKWSKNKGLAGVFSWQIMQDNGDLLDAMYQHMHAELSESNEINRAEGELE